MFSAESLGFLGDELDCREFVVEQFQCGILAQPFHFSTSMRMWTRSMDINTGLIRVHRYFLQYICNWCEDATSCASPHWEVEQMTAILYIWTACMSLLTSTEFSWIWMEGKRSKRGYGNIHSRAYSGHVLRFLHVTGMVAML